MTTSLLATLMEGDKREQAWKTHGDGPPILRSISLRHLGQFLLGNYPQLLPAVLFVSLLTLRPTNILQAPYLM